MSDIREFHLTQSARAERVGDPEEIEFNFADLYEKGSISRVGELNPYVTLACDLRCDYCYMHPFLQRARDVTELMSPSYFSGLVRYFAGGDRVLDRMTFLGGEPTLHPDITQMVNDAAQFNIKELRMTTNGVGLHHLDLERLERDAFDHVSVSIDGSDDVTNNATRGRGTFARIMRTISDYASAGIRLSVNYTVTSKNVSSLIDAADFFHEMGVKILNFHRASLRGNAIGKPELIVPAVQWVQARDELLSHLESHGPKYAGMTFRVPYTFLTQTQMHDLGYVPIQENNYHSPDGGHRLIVLPSTPQGRGLCYMSSDLIAEDHAELGQVGADGTFTWNSHPNNELSSFRLAPSANVSTRIADQDTFEEDKMAGLERVSHSFKKTLCF
ncbi:4Fe-4S single cluster protein [Curtobacterium sp. PhB130]|uniref:radical SAM protein n=1 Tax=Curtobacterium sp. PhB130 TaxID=2485178 RepID=UPI000FAD06EA|nr:radical SAM protein [Curtobacterium sp. PhB130]ROS75886.1 4Fe-4S single cluster protein [Curtobacterium sp. PhB130]